MAYDDGLAQLLRDDLEGVGPLEEKRMFGGLCFMLSGHMLCGVSPRGAMFRVGKEREAEALALDGVSEMDFTGRRMAGFVDADAEAMADDARRSRLLALARENVASLPPR